jgi:hypothetical protein
MTTDITRQPKGIPTGGQFAATAHSEPTVALGAQDTAPKTVTDHFLERETVKNKQRRLYEQLDRMNKIQAAHSLRSVAATILARFPGAVTLRVGADENGRDEYAPVSVANADGGLLQLNMPEADYDDEWTFEQMVQDGPEIRELVADLDYRDDSWTEGVGFVHGTGKRQRKMVDINLQAAVRAPDPFIAEEHVPYTRTLTVDEQSDLVEAANYGLTAIEDILDDHNSFDEHRQFQDLGAVKDRVTSLLTVTRPE